MPELPEVEMCRRDLASWTAGRVVSGVIAPDDLAVRHSLSTKPSDAVVDGGAQVAKALTGQTAREPVRKGKRIAWSFGQHALALHLGMTGRWRRGDEEPRWARLGLAFEGGPTVWLIDPRRFGCVSLQTTSAALAMIAKGLGPDGLVEPPSAEVLRSRLKGRRAIKVALLDQKVLAGLGNIHAAEALWRAGINPALPAGELSAAGAVRLAAAIPEQFRWALDAQGQDEDLVYVTDGGDNLFSVYGREGEACPRCGGAIAAQKQSGRSTYWCPACQA